MFSKCRNRKGVTLVELIFTLALVGILATSATYFIGDQVNAVRYEETRSKMDRIRFAILGHPGVDNEGRRTHFGFHGDMGRFPNPLTELTTKGALNAWTFDSTLGIGSGWRGPYYAEIFSGEDPITKDLWGRNFIYNTGSAPPYLTSYAADGLSGGASYSKDLGYQIHTDARQAASVQGYLLDGTAAISGSNVELFFTSDGTITSSTTATTAAGLFTFQNIPYGQVAIKVTSAPTIGAKVFTIDTPQFSVPAGFLNYNNQGP